MTKQEQHQHHKQEGAKEEEVKVGSWDWEGTFTGQVIRFAGEFVGDYRELTGQTSSRFDRGTAYTLYKCGEDSYRVYVEKWSRWQGEQSYARLLPDAFDAQHYVDEPEDPQSSAPPPARTRYQETYTEAQARASFPQLFAAIDEPNID
jgi:hypothetical protein